MANNSLLNKCIEIIPSRLYFQCLDNISTLPSGNDTIRYMKYYLILIYIYLKKNYYEISFGMDSELIYTAFFADFGPLHLGLTYK